MGWKKKPNLAQYGSGNWDGFVKKVGNLTAEEAMRIAFANSDITFFFFCRETIILDQDPAVKYGPFNAGDPCSSLAFRGTAALLNAIRTRKQASLPSTLTHVIISNFKR